MDSNVNQNTEKGQNVILIALMMMVFIGLLALVLDGGFSYASRRAAQNAADAGALAGANILCGATSGDASAAAWDYAVTRNGAVDADIQIAEKIITVTATLPHQSFFAGLIGQEIVTTTATASAGCFSPCLSEGVLPVAWACAPPVGGDPEDDCEIQAGTIDPDVPGPLYMVMDSEKSAEDYFCQEPPNSGSPAGALDCDFIGGGDANGDGIPDGDGENDLMVGGGRSWLDLNGDSANASELKTWIGGGYADEIPNHLWLPASTAVDTSVFITTKTRVGDYVILPVFDDYTLDCDPEPPETSCHSKWHTGVDDEFPTSGTKKDYYHIISFSLFRITGVSTSAGPGGCEGDCTAKNYLVDDLHWMDANTKTIEGYFVEGYVPGLGGKCDFDAGAYTIYLDH